ncbi:hypothetical protein BH10ACI3_BH10ACI3_06140 [soil metagenome]
MTPNVNSVYDDALTLPLEDRKELVRKLLSRPRSERKRKGDVTRFFGMIDSGDPDSANNERIDADLAREYGNDHAATK